jgi:hypothetical protein
MQSSTSGTPTPDPAPSTPVAPAPTQAPAAPAQANLEYFSTDYKTHGYTVDEILWVEDVVTVTVSYTSSAIVPGRRAKRHLHQHHV